MSRDDADVAAAALLQLRKKYARLMRARAQMVGLGDDNAALVVMLLVVTPMSRLLLLAAEL